MDNKTRPLYSLSTRDSFHIKDTERLKVKGLKERVHKNGNENKKSGIVILIPDKTDF